MVVLFDLGGVVENVLVKNRYQPVAVHMALKRAKAILANGDLIDSGFIRLHKFKGLARHINKDGGTI